MNVNLELIKLMDKEKRLEEAKISIWKGFASILGTGIVFAGGCVLCLLTIETTPHWVIYLAIGSAIFTAFFCLLLYYFYAECKKKSLEIRLKVKEIEKRK